MQANLRWIALTVALSLSLAASAHAQTDRAAAEVLFQEGRKAMKQQDYAAACPKLEESLRLDRAPGTLLNLAECEEKLGKLASAWQRFDELVQTLKRDDPRLKVAKKRASTLEKMLPHLTIQLRAGASKDSSVRIKLDGVELSTASVGVAFPVDPGSHAVVVTAPGRSAKTYEIEIASGEKKQLDVELGAEEKPSSAAPEPPPKPVVVEPKKREKPSPPVLGYVLGGVGVAALATSAVAGGIALGKKKTVEKECTDKFCSDKGLDAASAGKTWATVSTVSFAAGVVLTGVGGYLIISHDREKSTLAWRRDF